MTTVDLSTPAPAPESTLDGLPRRVSLTLPELQLLAQSAGGAPLPFEVTTRETDSSNPLESRLGQSRQAADDSAYTQGLTSLHDPAESLQRRGLLTGDQPDPGIAGALGLLATPAVAVDLDVSIEGGRVRAWHRLRDQAVAALATADGVVFELTWFDSAAWPGELVRAAVCPEDLSQTDSAVPTTLDLPFELLDAGSEAVRSGRSDLLSTIVAHHTGTVVGDGGHVVADATVSSTIASLNSETRGRLRALVADIDAGGRVIGVVSWVLLADGWRWLRPHDEAGDSRVEITTVAPGDLATSLGPVLAEVTA